MRLVAIICVCLAVCEAIRISPAPVRAEQVFEWPSDPSAQLNCKNEATWGLYIDGRDAHKGKGAYGKEYGKAVKPVFDMIYAKAEEKQEPGMELFTEIAKENGEHFHLVGTVHHLTGAVRKCLGKYPKEQFHEIMSDVMTLDENFKFAGSKGEQLTTLFAEYNRRQNLATEEGNKEEQLRTIAFLVLNLAFAHPLMDHNGRSRLLLTQHELRRLNLGCGTFMYNNNRDMTFNTLNETAGKIKEGMLMYNIWEETGVNPWTDKKMQKKHRQDFARNKKVKACWDAHLAAPAHMHAGTSVE